MAFDGHSFSAAMQDLPAEIWKFDAVASALVASREQLAAYLTQALRASLSRALLLAVFVPLEGA